MLTIYDKTGSSLVRHNDTAPIGGDTVWFDLLNPTKEEDASVEKLLGISVPTRAEIREIEASARFYQENGATYLTGYLLHTANETAPDGSGTTFILAGNRLVTVRYNDSKAFPQYLQRLQIGDSACSSGSAVLLGILETHIERMADLIESSQDNVDTLASSIFDLKGSRTRNRRLDVILKGIGREGDVAARTQESATSIDRVLHYLEHVGRNGLVDPKGLERIDAAQRDVTSLMEHMKFLTDRIQFLLDATLGMITTEQNQIIKLFSVMAVMLMPPTLVASIYGMNFESIHEFKWEHGYWWALGLMLVSAIIPFIYFKRKGWL